MNFKEYAKNKLYGEHEKILSKICMTVNNCALCYDEETRKTNCNPVTCLSSIYNVTKNYFYMDLYTGETNLKLIEIGRRNNYNVFIVPKEHCFKFEKK